jgi:hypothetical protein
MSLKYKLAIFFILATMLSPLAQRIAAQAVAQKTESAGPPRSERYEAYDGLLIPIANREFTCVAPIRKPNCLVGAVQDQRPLEDHTIYDGEGRGWFAFSSNPRSPEYYLRLEKEGFAPLGAQPRINSKGESLPAHGLVILRISGVSGNWIEVEVNEETRQKGYIPKSDPTWMMASWGEVFNIGFNVVIDPNRVKVLDRPDGKPAACERPSGKHTYTRIEGDWMLVNKMYHDEGAEEAVACMGWIRWRKGREILVGSIINGGRVPETSADKEP